MILWTIQHQGAYEMLLKKGYPRVEEKYLPTMMSGMIACCSDGTRPIIFKIERIDYDD